MERKTSRIRKSHSFPLGPLYRSGHPDILDCDENENAFFKAENEKPLSAATGVVRPIQCRRRYGRLRLSNVYGPETTRWGVPAEVQHRGSVGICQQNQDVGSTSFAILTTLSDLSVTGSLLDIPINAGSSDLTF